MLCEPTVSELMLSVAMPALLTVPLPMGVPLSRKLTVPVGMPLPPPEALIVAVSITAWPNTLVGGELARTVALGLLLTVWVTPLLPDAEDERKLASPLYVAVMLCEPAASKLMVSVARPALLTVPLPIGVPLSRKLTVPVGMPLPPPEALTVAVSVTAWPKTLVGGELVRTVALGLLFTV